MSYKKDLSLVKMGHLGLFHRFIQVAREMDEISEFQQYYLYMEGIFPALCCSSVVMAALLLSHTMNCLTLQSPSRPV